MHFTHTMLSGDMNSAVSFLDKHLERNKKLLEDVGLTYTEFKTLSVSPLTPCGGWICQRSNGTKELTPKQRDLWNQFLISLGGE